MSKAEPTRAEVLSETLAPGVLQLSLSDPARKNAMSPEMGEALCAQVAALRAPCERAEVRAVVLTGAGDVFSAGGDLAMLERLRAASFVERYEFMLEFYKSYLSVLDVPVPVIAVVRGAAIGAGLALAMACDVLLVAEDAKLALNFTQLGLHPGMGATFFLPLRVGAQRACEWLCTGRRFDGREAFAAGLALRALPSAELASEALQLATSFAASGALAARRTKQSLSFDRAALQRALQREAFAQAESYGSDEFAERLAQARARTGARS